MISQFSSQYHDLHKFRGTGIPFHVSFIGENGIDCGGLCRDLASEFFKEINNPRIGLFIPTPNSRNRIGKFRDYLIPSPNPRIQNSSDLYKSVGALLAIGLRTSLVQPFLFPPLFWCFLSGKFITEEHLFEIDHDYQRLIEQMREMAVVGKDAFNTRSEEHTSELQSP
jgi:hypothetical protein